VIIAIIVYRFIPEKYFERNK
ncbi:ECF transporter S component, partial [Clostridium botulinum]|nr:ECF transporter S component [Clostridium botulinum]